MKKQNLVSEVDAVINILKAELVKGDAFSKVYDSLLSVYEDAREKLEDDPDYDGSDLAGRTKKYVSKVSEEKANQELVEALWKVESLLKVMNR